HFLGVVRNLPSIIGPHRDGRQLKYGAQTMRIPQNTALFAFAAGAFTLICVANGSKAGQQSIVPLTNAHAHNDYEHKRPLFDALDHGFGSVEADVFLEKDQLLVAHTRLDLRPERTLEKLYLDPLRERIKANGGRVYKGGPPVWLLVDVKTEAKS